MFLLFVREVDLPKFVLISSVVLVFSNDFHPLQKLEEDLDVFNITICRQLAENEAEKKKKEKKEESGGGWWGWATSWVGGGKSDEEKATEFTPPSGELHVRIYVALVVTSHYITRRHTTSRYIMHYR